MIRHLCAALLASTVVLPGCAAAAEATLEQVFANPPHEAKPRVRWWWPGADVTAEELEREIALLEEGGFGGAEIQAIIPSVTPPPGPEAMDRVNDYAEPRFFELVRTAGKAAAARGMNVDYTFGSAWPSGGGFAIPPEKALVELTMAYTQVNGGQQGPLKVNIPPRTSRLGALASFDARTRDPAVADWQERFDDRAETVSVLAMRGRPPEFAAGEQASPLSVPVKLSAWRDVETSGLLQSGETIDLTDRLRGDGTLDWAAPEGDWLVFVFRKYASNMGALGAAGKGPQLVLDHFDRSAFAAHAARVGDPLGPNPVGIRATFVDSLELMQDLPWSEDFAARFRQLRGYDLKPYLPFLVQPGWMTAWLEHWSPPYFEAVVPDLAARVREDYRQTVSDLLFSEFLEPWDAWNKAHGLKSKFQAHGGALDQIRAYGFADIPETEDLVDSGDPLFMRFARSGAHLYGRRLVSAESLVWKDRPYDVTPDEMRRRLDLLFAGGVNSVNLHGMPYRYGRQWPGWHAFEPSPFALGFSTMLAETNPVWPSVARLANYAARMQALLQTGDAVVPVALFYGEIGYYVGIETAGDHDRPIETGLLAAGFDYDRMNPHAAGLAKVEHRELVSAGGQHYNALVLPPLEAIDVATVERIAGFAESGLPVFFLDQLPRRATGLGNAQENDLRVTRAGARALDGGARIISSAEVSSALVAANVPPNLQFRETSGEGLVFVQRRAADRRLTFLFNGSGRQISPTVILPNGGAVSQWDAMSGAIQPLDARAVQGGTQITPTILAGQGIMLVEDVRKPASSVSAAVADAQILVPPTAWSLSVDGHSGREAFQADLGALAPGDWRDVPQLARFAGAGIYRATFDVPAEWLSGGSNVALALGEVHDMARVTINGHALPSVVSAPWRIDISDVVKAGSNSIEVEVRNVPQNAMIGARGGFEKLVSVPAGLIGPVQIYRFTDPR